MNDHWKWTRNDLRNRSRLRKGHLCRTLTSTATATRGPTPLSSRGAATAGAATSTTRAVGTGRVANHYTRSRRKLRRDKWHHLVARWGHRSRIKRLWLGKALLHLRHRRYVLWSRGNEASIWRGIRYDRRNDRSALSLLWDKSLREKLRLGHPWVTRTLAMNYDRRLIGFR